MRGMREMEEEICQSSQQDLGRSLFTNFLIEVTSIVSTAIHDANNLHKWMKDVLEDINLALAPGSAYTRYEPLGVVCVIGSWNVPWWTIFKPLVHGISAGNCVLLKPSEMAPHASACMKKFVD